MTRTLGALTGAMTLLALLPSAARAQTGATPASRVPVIVAIADSQPYGQDIVILRRPDAAVPNLIVMSRPAATPERLAAAASTLAAIMERDGDRPAARGLYRVSATSAPGREIRSARAALARLGTGGRLETVAGVGLAHTTRIYLPSHAAAAPSMQRVRRGPGGGGGA